MGKIYIVDPMDMSTEFYTSKREAWSAYRWHLRNDIECEPPTEADAADRLSEQAAEIAQLQQAVLALAYGYRQCGMEDWTEGVPREVQEFIQSRLD